MNPGASSSINAAGGTEQTPVVIVGGGLTGLSAANFLAWHGVPSIVLERHRGSSTHPKARAINPRSSELLRSLGLEEQVRANRSPIADNTDLVHVITLAGDERVRLPRPPSSTIDELSPSGWSLIDQNALEPLLAAQLTNSPYATVRYRSEVVALDQDEDSVTVTVRPRDGGAEYRIRADYLVAADGSRSQVRGMLQIPSSGPGTLSPMVSFGFDADLSSAIRGRKIIAAYVHNEKLRGTLMPLDNDRRWVFNVSYDPAAGQRPEDFDRAWCEQTARDGVGDPDLDLTVESDGLVPWEIAARVADTMRSGRVFLAGDAAHVMPPTGAFGASSGIQDAHNLAWKLALVERHVAGAGLLDTYHLERHAVAHLMMDQSMLRFRIREGGAMSDVADQMLDELQMSFGYAYGAGAFAFSDAGPAASPVSPATHVWVDDPHTPSATPGARAPHVQLRRGGEVCSTLDLFGTDFVLLLASDSAAWAVPFREAAAAAGVPFTVWIVGPPDDPGAGGTNASVESRGLAGPRGPATADLVDVEGRWTQRYRTDSGGAVLVRPDGYVAWRSEARFVDEDLSQVFASVTGNVLADGARG